MPRAHRSEISGLHANSLKIRLQAPPVEGKANQALIRFLADLLDVPQAALRLVSGETGRDKKVLVKDGSPEHIRARLGV